ncbi:MAG TPA: hypothetical protein DD725_03520 [Deltaproteobacteria bacterium]|nr:hypothetical protein [Deltaproteobacteria bacterium]
MISACYALTAPSTTKRRYMKPALTEKEHLAIMEFKKRLVERLGENLVAIKLFGSRARGSYREGSDIDLLIILKKENRETEDILIDTRLEILNEFDVYPEIVSFALSRYQSFRNLQVPFLLNVEKDQYELYARE